jgi:hypothetical protein
LAALVLLLGSAISLAPPAPADHDGEDDPPTEVSDVTLQTPFHARDFERNVNTPPSWTWAPATDDHGVAAYEITEHHLGDDGTVYEAATEPDERTYEAQAPMDGKICIEVAAVDTAGQVGPASTMNCAWLDTQAPEPGFAHPAAATLQLASGETIPIASPTPGIGGDRAYALDELTVELRTEDPGPAAAGVWEVQPYNRSIGPLAGDERPIACENLGTPEECRWSHADDGRAWFDVRADAEDNAANTASAYRNYTMIDLAAVETPTVDGTSATVHWEPYEDRDFDRYEVYAVQKDGHEAKIPARLVASIEDPEQVSVVDEVPEVGETWTYHQTTYTATADAGIHVEETTHEATLTFAGEDGRVSDPRTCAPVDLCIKPLR